MLGLYIQEGSSISGYQSRERLGHWVFHTQGGINGALLTDLSKTFECLLHDFLIAKLVADDFFIKLPL